MFDSTHHSYRVTVADDGRRNVDRALQPLHLRSLQVRLCQLLLHRRRRPRLLQDEPLLHAALTVGRQHQRALRVDRQAVEVVGLRERVSERYTWLKTVTTSVIVL